MNNPAKEVLFDDFLLADNAEEFLESAYPFRSLMMQYQCAMMEMRTKFEVLNTELSLDSDKNPIESICCRIKKPISIIEKLRRKGLAVSLQNIETQIHDVAGIRIICSFPEDIYRIAEKIYMQDDIHVLEVKDYIKHPKSNGYRSLHLILEIPVFFSEVKKWMQVEVQLRTIAMDFWASIEHKIQYKKQMGSQDAVRLSEELRLCAEGIHAMDLRMQEINRQIELSRRAEEDPNQAR